MTATPKFSAADQGAELQSTHGLCPTCWDLVQLDAHGHIHPHRQIRVRRGPDGKPNEYRTTVRCDGGGQQPEPLNEEK